MADLAWTLTRSSDSFDLTFGSLKGDEQMSSDTHLYHHGSHTSSVKAAETTALW